MSKIIFTLLIGLITTVSTTAQAKQCIENYAGAVINIKWFDKDGKHDSKNSGNIAWPGGKSCQSRHSVGAAVIETEGCQFAIFAAQSAIFIAGNGLFGVCEGLTDGACTIAGPAFELATAQAMAAIPAEYHKKLKVAPNQGKTIQIHGNCFEGLKIE